MISKISFSYLVYTILVLAPIYQDSPFNQIIGAAGDTLVPLLCAFVLGYNFIRCRKLPFNIHIKKLLFMSFWLILVSFSACFFWIYSGNSDVILGEQIFIKSIKVWLQYIIIPIYIICLLSFMRDQDLKDNLKPFYISLILLSFLCFIEITQIPYAFKSLHSQGILPYYRVRLLTKEASWTTLLVLNYSVLGIYYATLCKKKLEIYVSFFCAISLLIFTDAKSLLLIYAIGLIVYVIQSLHQLKRSSIIGIFLALILGFSFYHFLGDKLFTSMINDIDNYTSVGTRLYTCIVGFLVGIYHPIGVGGGLYLNIFPKMLIENISLLNFTGISFNLSEIYNIANSTTDQAVTVKSGLLQYNMYWGICGTLYMLSILKRIYNTLPSNKIQHPLILKVLFITNILLIAFNSNMTFEFWLVIAFFINLSTHKKVA